MSIVVGSVQFIAGQQVEVPITLTADYWGINARLHYDPAALSYADWYFAIAGYNTAVNLIQPGELALAAFTDGASPPIPTEPEIFLTIRFDVSGSSALTLTDLGASDAAGMDAEITGVDGQVTIEETVMNYQLWWDPISIASGANKARVVVGDSIDPNDGTFSEVALVNTPFTEEVVDIGGGETAMKQLSTVFPLAANVGTKYAYVQFGDAEGDWGPIHTPIPLSTDVALPAATGVGYRVVP